MLAFYVRIVCMIMLCRVSSNGDQALFVICLGLQSIFLCFTIRSHLFTCIVLVTVHISKFFISNRCLVSCTDETVFLQVKIASNLLDVGSNMLAFSFLCTCGFNFIASQHSFWLSFDHMSSICGQTVCSVSLLTSGDTFLRDTLLGNQQYKYQYWYKYRISYFYIINNWILSSCELGSHFCKCYCCGDEKQRTRLTAGARRIVFFLLYATFSQVSSLRAPQQ